MYCFKSLFFIIFNYNIYKPACNFMFQRDNYISYKYEFLQLNLLKLDNQCYKVINYNVLIKILHSTDITKF